MSLNPLYITAPSLQVSNQLLFEAALWNHQKAQDLDCIYYREAHEQCPFDGNDQRVDNYHDFSQILFVPYGKSRKHYFVTRESDCIAQGLYRNASNNEDRGREGDTVGYTTVFAFPCSPFFHGVSSWQPSYNLCNRGNEC